MPKFLNIKYIVIFIVLLFIMVIAIRPNTCRFMYFKSNKVVEDDQTCQKKNWGELIKRAQISI